MEDEPIVLDDQSTEHKTTPTQSPEDPITHDADDLEDDERDEDFEESEGEKPDESPNDAESDDEQPDEDAERKEHNRQAYEQRQAAKQEAEQRNQEFMSNLYQQAIGQIQQPDENRYEEIAEEQGQEQAEVQRRLDAIEQREQQQRVDAAMQRIESQRNFVGMNIAQAESKIPLFNPDDQENYNEDLHKSVLADWAASSLETIVDDKGVTHIVGLRDGAQTPEEYMQEKAQLYGNVLQLQAAKAQADAQRNKKSGESPSSAKASTGKVDASLKAFDDAFDNY